MKKTESPERSRRILVVEDEVYLRELYVDILKNAGYQVDQAADGQSGYRAMRRGGYDLVLLDIILPKIDGLTILRRLQETPPAKVNQHLVILSNIDRESGLVEAKKLGAENFLIKSDLTPDQIINQVKKYLV
ncbi:MAG: response regulator [Candidatus Shapirobacteria bacterium]